MTTAIRSLAETIARVRELHHVIDGSDDEVGYCDEDGFIWPCQTVRAIDAAQESPAAEGRRALRERLIDALTAVRPRFVTSDDGVKVVAEDTVDALMPVIEQYIRENPRGQA